MKVNIVFITIVLVLILSLPLYASLEISVATDKQVYQRGETVEVYVSLYNPTAEAITIYVGYPIATYLMDDIYFWHQNKVFPAVLLPPISIEGYQSLTWQLNHDVKELEDYPLGAGIHSVIGYVYSNETIGQHSDAVNFEVIPEPTTLSLFALGAVLLKRKR